MKSVYDASPVWDIATPAAGLVVSTLGLRSVNALLLLLFRNDGLSS